MDRGKQPLKEIVGEWTTVHRKPNKGKAESNSKKGFVPAQIPFYPNQGYYVSYPMVNQPIGTNILNHPMVNQPIGTSFSNMPYQIWHFQTMIGSPRLLALNEDQEHLTKTIDKCQKDLSYYQFKQELI
ncbi:hypothetical protein Gotur_024256 [Gossypium turneri]